MRQFIVCTNDWDMIDKSVSCGKKKNYETKHSVFSDVGDFNVRNSFDLFHSKG